MSFVISYQGQIKPYELPDLSHYDRVHRVYRTAKSKKLKDENDSDDFEFERSLKSSFDGEHEQLDTSSNKKLEAYQKSDKAFQLDKGPHHARDIMSHPPHCISQDKTMKEALEIMETYTYRHLPVIDSKGPLVGILSDRDLLKQRREAPTKKIHQLMSSNVLTALESARIQDVVRIMLHEKIGALPILNEDYQLTGILSQTDILKVVATGQFNLNPSE